MGYYYISTVVAHDRLRNKYLIKQDSLLEYKMHEEECDVDFDVKSTSMFIFVHFRVELTQYYIAGCDAERAAAFLNEYRDVEKQLLSLHDRIERLTKWNCFL